MYRKYEDWELDYDHPRNDEERQRIRELAAEVLKTLPQPPPRRQRCWPYELARGICLLVGFVLLSCLTIGLGAGVPLLLLWFLPF